MKKTTLLCLSAAIMISALTGFQCGSAEMTSAKMYIQRSEWANAEQSLTQEVAKNPDNAEAWYLLGFARLKMTNYRGMNEAFGRCLALSNKHERDIREAKTAAWGQLFNEGVDTYMKGKKTEGDSAAILMNRAVEKFTTALTINPDSASTYTNLGLAYLGLDDFDNAAGSFEQALQRVKEPDLAGSLGNMYLERGRKLQGEAQSASGSRKDSLTNAAKDYFNKAIATLGQAREWWPDDTNIVGTLLDAYVAAGRTEEAMINFSAAVERNPNNKLYRYNFGVLLLKAGKHRDAVEQFESAVIADQKFEDAMYNLGVAYLQWGAKRRSEAEAASRGSREKKVDKSYEEQFRKAKDTLQQLRDMRPTDPDVWEALGQAYANLNMQKQASESFNKADELRKRK